jgi:GST-like protein
MAFLPRNRPQALLGTGRAFPVCGPRRPRYAVNRYHREAERHYRVLDSQLAGRDYIVGSDYTIVDMSAWGWIDRTSRVMKGADDPLAPFPNVKRWFTAIDGRPAVTRARAIGKDHEFKKVNEGETKRAPFPAKYPATDS